MSRFFLVMLVAAGATVVLAPAGIAQTRGNAENAKLCQKGGSEILVRADFSSFGTEGCASATPRAGEL